MKIFLLLICVFLSACSPTDGRLQTIEQVTPWVEQVKLAAEQQVVAAPRDTSLLAAPIPEQMNHVFAPVTTLAAKPLPTLAPVQVNLNYPPSFDEPPAILPPPVLVQKNINLSQAAASELKYVGLLSHDGMMVGMVKVAERLYPVHVGDKIGQGQWSVLAVNAQTMQIKIAQKAVVYDKN